MDAATTLCTLKHNFRDIDTQFFYLKNVNYVILLNNKIETEYDM